MAARDSDPNNRQSSAPRYGGQMTYAPEGSSRGEVQAAAAERARQQDEELKPEWEASLNAARQNAEGDEAALRVIEGIAGRVASGKLHLQEALNDLSYFLSDAYASSRGTERMSYQPYAQAGWGAYDYQRGIETEGWNYFISDKSASIREGQRVVEQIKASMSEEEAKKVLDDAFGPPGLRPANRGESLEAHISHRGEGENIFNFDSSGKDFDSVVRDALNKMSPVKYDTVVRAAIALGGKVSDTPGSRGKIVLDDDFKRGRGKDPYVDLVDIIIDYDNKYGTYKESEKANNARYGTLGAEFINRGGTDFNEDSPYYKQISYDAVELADYAGYWGHVAWRLNGQGIRATGLSNWEEMDYTYSNVDENVREKLLQLQENYLDAYSKYQWAKRAVQSSTGDAAFYPKFMYYYLQQDPFWESEDAKRQIVKIADSYSPEREAEMNRINEWVENATNAGGAIRYADTGRTGGGISDERVKDVSRGGSLAEDLMRAVLARQG